MIRSVARASVTLALLVWRGAGIYRTQAGIYQMTLGSNTQKHEILAYSRVCGSDRRAVVCVAWLRMSACRKKGLWHPYQAVGLLLPSL